MSIRLMPLAAITASSMPRGLMAVDLGCNVLTRPAIISGKPCNQVSNRNVMLCQGFGGAAVTELPSWLISQQKSASGFVES